MMFIPGGTGPPGPRNYERTGEKTPPRQASWFGARLRVTSERCRLADELFRLAWRVRKRTGAGKNRVPDAKTAGE